MYFGRGASTPSCTTIRRKHPSDHHQSVDALFGYMAQKFNRENKVSDGAFVASMLSTGYGIGDTYYLHRSEPLKGSTVRRKNERPAGLPSCLGRLQHPTTHATLPDAVRGAHAEGRSGIWPRAI